MASSIRICKLDGLLADFGVLRSLDRDEVETSIVV